MTDIGSDDGRVRAIKSDDLELVLAWRNHPEVRRYMLTQQQITLDEHLLWYEQSCRDATRYLLVYERAGVAEGFVQFTGACKGSAADWGFYTAPDSSRGTGKKLGRAALDFGFRTIGLHKICGRALDFNSTSIRFHRALGFRQEGLLREQHLVGGSYRDLVCFGLLQSEWEVQSPDEANGLS